MTHDLTDSPCRYSAVKSLMSPRFVLSRPSPLSRQKSQAIEYAKEAVKVEAQLRKQVDKMEESVRDVEVCP